MGFGGIVTFIVLGPFCAYWGAEWHPDLHLTVDRSILNPQAGQPNPSADKLIPA